MLHNRATLIIVFGMAILAGMMGCIASAENTTVMNGTSTAGGETAVDLVCGMAVDPSTAQFSQTFEGQTYYFCSAMCRDQFNADPSKFITAAKGRSVIDPVCLMKVSPDTAGGNAVFNGTEYFFCSPDCKTAFVADPEKFLSNATSTQVTDPVCGMSVDSSTAVNTTYKGTSYYFCCSKCEAKFEKDPEAYLSDVVGTSADDLVCGMTVDPTMALSTVYNGKTYYFCSDACKEQFVQDPQRYLAEKADNLAPADAPGPGGHQHD